MLWFNVATLTFASSDSVDAESKALTSEKQKRFMMAARCPVGGETASDSRRHSGSVWGPARSAGCLLRLKPQWNPSTNPTDGPPLLHQPKHNSLLTTSPSLVELQDESLFQILFFSFFCREALFSSHVLKVTCWIIWLTHFKIYLKRLAFKIFLRLIYYYKRHY